MPLSPPPCIYTLKGISRHDIILVSLSLDLSHSRAICPTPSSPRWPLYPCLSRIRNTHTYLSRPRQMYQLHIHTCYITYPIDLKSPLFTFISHTTFLLNKVWPKNILEFLHIYNITKLYGGVRTLICIAWCPQWYLFRTVNLYIFILYTKLVIIKRNEEHLSLHRIPPPLYALSRMHTKLSPGPLKVSPPAHSRMFHLSLAIYTVTIIVFEAKARYVHWTSESTHYGHHLRLVVIIQSRAHRTTLYLLMTWLVDQLNAPRGTSSVASHYLTTIMPTCRLVSTLHLHSYKIHKIHSYKKQSWWWWCACHPTI